MARKASTKKSARRATTSKSRAGGAARKSPAKAARKTARKTTKKAARKPVKKTGRVASGTAGSSRAAGKRAPARKVPKKKAAAKKSASSSGQARGAAPSGRKRRIKAIPPGYHSVTPYLIVRGAAAAIDFYRSVFGAEELTRVADLAGRVGHAEIRIGGSVVMLADEFPEMDFKSPKTLGGTTGSILLYVEDVDAVFARALEAGAVQMRPVENQFYGDRSGTLEDPFGHRWTVSTHKGGLSGAEKKTGVDGETPSPGA